MTITINLDPEDETKLIERAAQNGQDVSTYVHRLIARDLMRVDEALAPFRRQVEESGMTDQDLRDFFEEVREEVFRDKHGNPSEAL